MESELGRFFDPLSVASKRLLRACLDFATGMGADTVVSVNGRRLVVRREHNTEGRGFVWLSLRGERVVFTLPEGEGLFDPSGRARGGVGRSRQIEVSQVIDIDGHVRRMVEEAYRNDEPAAAADDGFPDWDF